MKASIKGIARAGASMFVAASIAGMGAAMAGNAIVAPLPGLASESPGAATAQAGPGFNAKADGTEERSGAPEAPASGSRLLRALVEGVEAGGISSVDAAPVLAAEGCPRALLRRLLAGAVDEADVLSALAIEREALGLCRERQEIVAALFETEALLRELRAPAAVAATAAVVQPPDPQIPESAPPAPSPLLSTLAVAETATDAEPEGARTPRYAWFSIIGSAGALRAGITDGDGVWFVREGDALPDGGTVAAIAGRPPGVRVRGSEGEAGETPLPWRARPGGGS
ncbi:MAG: hypothetical protein OXN81_09940 [Alphaproteobacteria bacterium]|nr:hypothetical protein [Alphaproteobacteria bacterium]